MKLRIKGDSLRLRVSPSEMTRLLQFGRVDETIHFGPQHDAKLTYALVTSVADARQNAAISVRYEPQEVAVVVSAAQARSWADGSNVGVYAEIDTGTGKLDIAVEKDFACLDKNDEQNEDTFPNPNQGVVC